MEASIGLPPMSAHVSFLDSIDVDNLNLITQLL